MNTADRLLAELHEIVRQKWGDRANDFPIPPPVFKAMKGELLEIDPASASLKARFPILESQLNPYGTMQGGMITAAVDNTIGPLSVVVAPPNVTRSLEVKFSRPARPEMQYIVVHARLAEREDPKLVFEARVTSPGGDKLATCKAVHWIVENI